jgi:integrase
MGRTRTSGIIVDADGNRIVNKRYRGTTLYRRLGRVSQEEAEQWLSRQIEEQRKANEYGTRPGRSFADAAEKFLIDHRDVKASIETDAYHITTLLPFIGNLELREIHDGTLQDYIKARRKTVSNTTIKRALEVVRRILNLSARKWRHPNGLTWLETAPLLSMPSTRDARKPYPISWEEQAALLPLLPEHLARMALFAVNTGCREQEICRLSWRWEIQVPELQVSVFVIPPEVMKNREPGLVVLNSVARSVIEACRGNHANRVFTWKRGPKGKVMIVDSMNNTAWQRARAKAGIPVRVHDLRHTFGRRLRAAGVSVETRKALLRHKTGDITTHYSAPEIGELVAAAELALQSRNTPTMLRVIESGKSQAGKKKAA